MVTSWVHELALLQTCANGFSDIIRTGMREELGTGEVTPVTFRRRPRPPAPFHFSCFEAAIKLASVSEGIRENVLE